jgi:nucleotide-binding universal stress UspA family protein
MIELRRILLPTDFSDTADVALKYSRTLADVFNASLTLLHVIMDPFVHGWTGEGYVPDLPAFREELAIQSQDRLNKVLTDAERQRFHAQFVVKFGEPFVEIVRYAKSEEIDLIVMGTHGRGAVAHMLMGSVAEKVVRKAPCPVLTVRHPQHEFVMP